MALNKLKKFLQENNIDFFIQPNCDSFFSEYLPDHCKRIEFITNFSGSNACVIFGKKKSYFFTDSRYTLQAADQIDNNEFEIINLAKQNILSWFKQNLSQKQIIALDTKLFNINFISDILKITDNKNAKIKFLDHNPIDNFWISRPKIANSKIYFCDNKFTGQESQIKRQKIILNIKGDALLISNPQNLCWLLNIRASDVKYSPILLSYAILYKDGSCDLFADKNLISDIKNPNLVNVNIIDSNLFEEKLIKIKEIDIVKNTVNYHIFAILQKNNIAINYKNDDIEQLRAIKNKSEIVGTINAHYLDGSAVTKFLYWIDQAVKNNIAIDELSAADKLYQFRKENEEFIYPSFATISSFASNGAVIHYHPTSKTNKKITGNSLYLVDSGGQYNKNKAFGTTDITRTIAIGNVSQEMINNFTNVLKGHIAIANAKIPYKISGANIDILARYNLYKSGLDYDHGTGHGVGSFLSVHEGGCGISKNCYHELKAGMIISNEPGFYKDNEYGIRIENLILVKKDSDDFLCFKTISLAPIDQNLINFKMLTFEEKKWLIDYHIEIYDKIAMMLNIDEKDWLANIIKVYQQNN
jgi:Xaa-Pro aminopeptidase